MAKSPAILVTGASGFIGRHVLELIKDDFIIYGVGRRTPTAAGVPLHPNLRWIPADVTEVASVRRVVEQVNRGGGADFVLHLAGYYDFTGEDRPEYTRTNVEGTHNVLEAVREVRGLRRFVFISSLTVSELPEPGVRLDENSPCDADFPYGVSKRRAEELVRAYAAEMPCSIVRPAAIFSDYCEYAPLYQFLKTWLSPGWKSRILGGKGLSAIPYLHIEDFLTLLMRIFERSDELPRLGTYVASVDEPTSHLSLYTIASRYFHGRLLPPILLPRRLSAAGVWLMNLLLGAIGRRPFERPWMMKYIDRTMPVNAAHTRAELGWSPISRRDVKRRLLFMIENMKSNPVLWRVRNEESHLARGAARPKYKIYAAMMLKKEQIVDRIVAEMTSEEHRPYFATYQRLCPDRLRSRVEMMYQLVEVAVRLGDRVHILSYARNLARERFHEGFFADEVVYAVNCTGAITVDNLHADPELQGMEERIRDEIMLTIQLVTDEIEDTFDRLVREETRELADEA